MEVRLWISSPSTVWLTRFLLVVSWCLPGTHLAAQGFGLLGDGGPRRLPPIDSSEPPPPIEFDPVATVRTVAAPVSDPAKINALVDEQIAEAIPIEPVIPDYAFDLSFELFGRPYNYEGSGTPQQSGGIFGAGDTMGIFTIGLAQRGWWRIGESRIQLNPAIHWVSGPIQTDMPPRLYDLDLGFVRRNTVLVPELTYEIALRVGFFTDFEGSAREGLRFPGHAVMFLQLSEDQQLVLGLDYLDRDDVAILPVVGASLHLTSRLWVEAIFPKPRIAFRIGPERWFYLAARMGGGMWAIERVSREDDVVTYRDYQVVLGIQQDHLEGHIAFLEVGVAFDRALEYRSGIGDYQPGNSAIVRTVLRY
jgi:hypothetical protein